MVELYYQKQLERMIATSDETGLIQHSDHSRPDLTHGYSVDDVARGLIVLARTFPRFDDRGVHRIYLDYIKKARRIDGFFHNFLKRVDGKWQWIVEDSGKLQDCFGRVMWALSEFTGSQYPATERAEAEKIFLEHLDFVGELEHNASESLTLLGLADYFSRTGNRDVERVAKSVAENLAEEFHKNKDDNEGWMWFSDEMTYCNPKLPHPMITAGYALKSRDILYIGKKSLDFLISKSFDEDGIFHAIGNQGWFPKGREPAKYDQQTVEAGDMVEACVDAFIILGNEKYKGYARKAFQWFSGKNIAGKSMIDNVSGGVYDAITENGINPNQGAESILSYLLAATKLERLE